MANDIFGYDTTYGGSLRKSSKGGFAFSDAGAIALVQSWSVQYSQNIQPLYEVGSSKIYFAGASAGGTLTVNRIVTKSGKDIVSLLGSLCDPKAPRIIATGDCKSDDVTLQLRGCVVSSVAWSGQAANAYVSEDVQAQFVGLEYT